MKHLLLAALLSVMTIPAFAQVQSSGQDELAQATGDQQLMDEQNFTPADEQSVDEQALPPHWPQPDRPDRPGWPGHDRPGHGWPGGGHHGGHWYFTCYARDIFGRQFWGQSYDQYQAQRNALYGCQRASFPIPIRSCRIAGCQRSWQ